MDVVQLLRFPEVRTDPGGTQFLNTIDPATAEQVFDFDWQGDGSNALFADLGADGALIETNLAKSSGLRTGDEFTRHDQPRQQGRLHGPRRVPRPGPVHRHHGLQRGRQRARHPVRPRRWGWSSSRRTPTRTRCRPRSPTRWSSSSPSSTCSRTPSSRQDFESQIDQLLALLYALLAISLIISLFGIVNALVLSIYERTREIGMLRAIGTTQRQMRSIVRYESIITAVIGGVLGILIGVLFAWVLSRGLEDQGIEFSLPVTTLVVFLVLAILAGDPGGGPAGPPGGAAQPAGGPPPRVSCRGWVAGQARWARPRDKTRRIVRARASWPTP